MGQGNPHFVSNFIVSNRGPGKLRLGVCVKLYLHVQRVEIGRLIGGLVSNFIGRPHDEI